MENENDTTGSAIPDVLGPLTPPPVAPTEQESQAERILAKQVKTASAAGEVITQTYAAMCGGTNRLLGLVNKNPFDLTPRQAAAAFGVRGGTVLQALAHIKEVAKLLGSATGRDPDKDILPSPDGISYGVNEDGTIKVIEH